VSSYFFGNFFCEDQDSDGTCAAQCSLCKLKAERKGGDIDPRTDKEKMQAIRRKQLSQLSHT
jgi:hypothetical protein